MIKNCISVLQGGAVMIYLDNSATTQPYKEVIDAFVKVSSTFLVIHHPSMELVRKLKNYCNKRGDR